MPSLRNPLAEFEAVVVAAEIDAEDFPGHLLLGGLALHEGHCAEFLAFATGELGVPERLDLSLLFVLETGLYLLVPLVLEAHDDMTALRHW